MFQTTRRRLALWYTVVTAILLLLFATGIYLYVRTLTIERVDDTLKHAIQVVERYLVIERVDPQEGKYRVNLEASFRNNNDPVDDDRVDVEWFSPSGELLWSTFDEPLNLPLNLHPHAQTVHLSSDRLLRQVIQKVQKERYLLGYLRVSHPWFEVTKPIRQLSLDLTVAVLLMLACTAAIGWFLSGIAIKPVRDSYQSLKQFTADASHELRNPIATIQTNVEMALSYSQSQPDLQDKQLRVIQRLAKRLGHLVDDLLFLARSDSGIVKTENREVPLDALLIEVIEEQKIIAEQKGIALFLTIVEPEDLDLDENSLEIDLFTVKGDWEQLARLFTNSIANAIEYSFSDRLNRDIFVEVELKFLVKERSPYLQVKVKDNGKGIPESALPQIFDRFYRIEPYNNNRASQQRSGAGLGLAIAKAIVENHRGQITVDSTIDRGTTFTITIPATKHEKS
ncbi:MAG: sensor histidine kinase [Prochloraceae cyanobacterium]